MPEMLNANFKIPIEDKRWLEKLIASSDYRSLSQIYREAVSEFIAKYTNRPTLMSLDQQMQRLRARADGYDKQLREIRREIHVLKGDIEAMKK